MAYDVQTVRETLRASHSRLQTRANVVVTGVGYKVTRGRRTERHRPAPDGVTIGHHAITAGALGCLVQKNGQVVILANNHMLTHSNDVAAGDAILPLGPHDGGKYPMTPSPTCTRSCRSASSTHRATARSGTVPQRR